MLASGETLRSGPIGLDSVLKARGKTEVGPLPVGLRIGKSLPPLLPEPGPEPVDHLSSDDEKALALDERSSNSSNDEEACDSDGDESPPPLPPPPGPPPPAAPLLDAGPVQVLPGLYDFDRAPSKRSAKCFVCQAQIPVGSYRWLLMPNKPGGVKYHMHIFFARTMRVGPTLFKCVCTGVLRFFVNLYRSARSAPCAGSYQQPFKSEPGRRWSARRWSARRWPARLVWRCFLEGPAK